MTKTEIQTHTHYKLYGSGCACGWGQKVIDAKNAGLIPADVVYPLSCIKGTTDVRKVTCGDCARWLLTAVGAVIVRIENPEVPKET